MADVTDATFDEEVLKSDIPVLVDFWAPWCGPCHSFSPIFEEVSEEYPAIFFGKVNVDYEERLPQHFGVMSIPSILIIREGFEIQTSSGLLNKDQ